MNKRICVAIICCVAAVGCQPNKRDVKKEFYGNGQVKTIDSIDAVAHIVTRYGYDERGHYVSYCRYVNDSADGIFYSTIGTVDRVTKIRYFKGGKVWYAKTTNWNRIGAVMTDSLPDTAYFTLPAGMPNGTYSLVLSANGFSSSPTTFTLPCSPTGVEQVSTTNNAVKAYPNPSKGIFTIEAELPMPNSVLEVDNMMGQQILREQVNLTKNDIDLSGQPEGIYFYRLLNSEGNLIGAGKLVVQK